MTVIVKITSGENKADENVSKGFELIPIAAGMRAAFIRDDEGKGWLNVHGNDDHGEERLLMVLPVLGNAYVMDAGKTIASFSSANISDNGQENPTDKVRGDFDYPTQELEPRGTARVIGDMTNNPPEVIEALTPELQEGVKLSAIEATRAFIVSILYERGQSPSNQDEESFVQALAVTIETYRNFNVRRRPPINLAFLGHVSYDLDRLQKLTEQFRLVADPIGLRLDYDANGCVTQYSVDMSHQYYDVREADILLLRQLRNEQEGLVKNAIDKIIKYYKAGVSVVPLDPATRISLGKRRQIVFKLNEVLDHAKFSFISSDSDLAIYGKQGPVDEDGIATYTHVVIKFTR
jgi:hypothetical protein